MTAPAKMAVLAALYFSQGLPFGFFTQALPVMLRKQGFSLGEIGLSSLLALPWALKFLWAPAVDRFAIPRFGKRRSWIVPLQLTAIAILTALSASSDAHSMAWLMAAVLLLNLVAATQDIATDGFAVDSLSASERGFGNGLQVAGYRVGMIAGGGVLLIVFDRLGASLTFLAMAALIGLSTLPILATRERPASDAETTRGAPRHFLRRQGVARLLVLIVVYKAGDAFATGMLRPFLADAGLSLSQIGWLVGTVGFAAGLLGALCGGALVNRLGRKRSLIAFGVLQALAVLGYAVLAYGKPSLTGLYGLCAFEHFAGGMATAALFTCMMDWCSAESSATDYTVQASAVVIATGAAASVAGFSAQALGYFHHFCLAALLALGSVVAVRFWFPDAVRVRAIRDAGSEVAACA